MERRFYGNENVAGRVFSGCRNDHIGLTTKKLRGPPSLSASFLARHPQSHSAFTGLAFLTWLYAYALYCFCAVAFWDHAASIFIGRFTYLRARKQE